MFKYTVMTNNYQETDFLVNKIINKLKKVNCKLDEINPEYIFVIGGDGTFLKAVNKFQHNLAQQIFVPIHCGGLGFYTNHNQVEDLDEIIESIINNDFKLVNYDLLEVKNDQDSLYAINEIKLINEIHPVSIEVFINNDFYELFRGTGLVFSTSTGSTGYNKSAGGAVILDNNDIYQMLEIFPIVNNKFKTLNAPLVMSKTNRVTLNIGSDDTNLIADTVLYPLKKNNLEIFISKLKVKSLILKKDSISKAEILNSMFVTNQLR